jgi:hypothetical protein
MSENWREGALCAQTFPDLFTPDTGAAVTDAVKVCDNCPAALPCLVDGWNEPVGVRGGISPRPRSIARRSGLTPEQALAEHRAKRQAEIERQWTRAYELKHYPCGHLRSDENSYPSDPYRCKTCSNSWARQKRTAA